MNIATQVKDVEIGGVPQHTDGENHSNALPSYVNLEKWEDAGYVWTGKITPKSLQRLVSMVPEPYQDESIKLRCELVKQDQLLTLIMDFSGEVWMICQRCLQSMPISVTHQSQLILLQNEAQESLVNSDDEYLMLDELLVESPDSKTADRLLPLGRLVEDELLLDLPLSAKHDDCEMAVQQVGEIIEEETENPFAVLESLKGKL